MEIVRKIKKGNNMSKIGEILFVVILVWIFLCCFSYLGKRSGFYDKLREQNGLKTNKATSKDKKQDLKCGNVRIKVDLKNNCTCIID